MDTTLTGMNVTKEFDGGWMNVYLNGILHLRISYNDLLGVQSWIDDDGRFYIRYYLKQKTMTSVYDNYDTWKLILEQI